MGITLGESSAPLFERTQHPVLLSTHTLPYADEPTWVMMALPLLCELPLVKALGKAADQQYPQTY